jgi:hypothetical protein
MQLNALMSSHGSMMTQMQSPVQNQMSDRGSTGSSDGEAAAEVATGQGAMATASIGQAEAQEQSGMQAAQAEMPAVSATPEAGSLASYQGRRVDITA